MGCPAKIPQSHTVDAFEIRDVLQDRMRRKHAEEAWAVLQKDQRNLEVVLNLTPAISPDTPFQSIVGAENQAARTKADYVMARIVPVLDHYEITRQERAEIYDDLIYTCRQARVNWG